MRDEGRDEREGEEGSGKEGGSYLVNRGLEDNLGLVHDLHSQDKLEIRHTHTNEQVYIKRHTLIHKALHVDDYTDKILS